MVEKVRKAVFPAAGLGTRLLPATKAIPKAMLNLIDRPLIQYAVDEARAVGIEHFVFVVGGNDNTIEEHFNGSERAKPTDHRVTSALGELNRDRSTLGTNSFTRQPAPLGLGHAVWCARELIGDEAFAVLTPDVVMRGNPGCLAQILETYYATGGNVVSVEECSPSETSKYGIVGTGERISDAAFRITGVVEKPGPASAPSNLKMSGRYVLQPQIFTQLAAHDFGFGGEIQLSDALSRLAEMQSVFGHLFQGRTFDCGSRKGLVAAGVALALGDPELAAIVQHEIDAFTLQAERAQLAFVYPNA